MWKYKTCTERLRIGSPSDFCTWPEITPSGTSLSMTAAAPGPTVTAGAGCDWGSISSGLRNPGLRADRPVGPGGKLVNSNRPPASVSVACCEPEKICTRARETGSPVAAFTTVPASVYLVSGAGDCSAAVCPRAAAQKRTMARDRTDRYFMRGNLRAETV